MPLLCLLASRQTQFSSFSGSDPLRRITSGLVWINLLVLDVKMINQSIYKPADQSRWLLMPVAGAERNQVYPDQCPASRPWSAVSAQAQHLRNRVCSGASGGRRTAHIVICISECWGDYCNPNKQLQIADLQYWSVLCCLHPQMSISSF